MTGTPRRRTGARATPAHRRGTSSVWSAPALVAATAAVLGCLGAVAADAERSAARPAPGTRSQHGPSRPVLAEVSAGAGTAVDAVLAGRERALSRGLPRQALRQVAERQLQQAAESQARRRSAALADLAAGAAKQADRLRRLSWRLPVRRGAYHLTAGFGECSWLWSHCHTGLDFAADEGTPIHAVAAGVVRRVGWAGAYGYRTIETLPDGTRLWYCHQSATDVRAGQQVRAGEVIGAVGSTGNVTGPHVHLEVRPTPGHPVDPKQALVAHGVKP